MKNKIHILQFMPYFPPHKWWLETVGEEIGKYWVKNNLWEFINIVTEFEQNKYLNNYWKITYLGELIWYKKDWVEILVCPSLEIINNFPVYKIWSKKYRLIIKYLKERIWDTNNNFRVITHTRFFLTSLIGWLFARKIRMKWIHIEHGSSYVKLSSKIKSYLARTYDKIFWKWIFKKADIVLAISKACKNFINKEFVDREVNVFYRGVDIGDVNIKKTWVIKFIFIWRLVKLKWVEDLLKAYKKTWLKNKLIIIWDWEEKNNLKLLSRWFNIIFMWYKNRKFIIKYLSENNCILINPSYQEWIPTTVIEWLFTSSITIASDVWWTREISNKEDLILFKAWNIRDLKQKMIFSIKNYNKLKGLSIRKVKYKFNWKKRIISLYNMI